MTPAVCEHQAGVVLALHIGQHVRHRDFNGRRVTGTVFSLGVQDNALMARIGLDEPIVIEAREPGDRPINIYTQHVPAHELAPFDARDELIAEMLAALRALVEYHDDVPKAADQRLLDAADAAIAKATGGAA